MQISVKWEGESSDPDGSSMRFTAETESGHRLEMDGAPSAPGEIPGGKDLAARPMELVLAGTGGCTAYDVVLILRRARQHVDGCAVRVDAERAIEDPRVFTRIHFHFIVTGRALRREMVERAIDLSHTKYCSASVMLGKTAVLSHSYEVIESAALA